MVLAVGFLLGGIVGSFINVCSLPDTFRKVYYYTLAHFVPHAKSQSHGLRTFLCLVGCRKGEWPSAVPLKFQSAISGLSYSQEYYSAGCFSWVLLPAIGL